MSLPGLAEYLREHGIRDGSPESAQVCRAWVAATLAERERSAKIARDADPNVGPEIAAEIMGTGGYAKAAA